jgi:hypothetical protein
VQRPAAPPSACGFYRSGPRRRRLAILACCAAALAGCDRSPAAAPQPPTVGFDPAGVDSALTVVSGVLGSPAMLSLTALSSLLTATAAPPVAPAAAPTIACAPVAGRSAPRSDPAAPGAGTLAGSVAGLIADSLLRHVVVYDTAARGYRVSADTSGPTGGLRFLLYQVSSYGLPTVPLTTDGWLDLTDQSAGSALQLRSQVSSGTAGIADYLVGLSGTQAADTAWLGGTATDGVHVLSFRDSTRRGAVGGTVALQVAVSAHVADSLDGFSVDMFAVRTSFDPFDYDDTLDFTLTRAPQTVRLVGAITTYCLVPAVGIRISVNDSAYATITNGTGTTPNVTLVGGQPAGTAASQTLLGLTTAQQRLFGWLGALFAPAKALLPRS